MLFPNPVAAQLPSRPMASHLVTVITTRSRMDLVLPGNSPMRDLIPQIVNTCVDYQHRSPSARWALSLSGTPPFAPDDTLDRREVLDGSILFLRDMTQAVVPDRVLAPDLRTAGHPAIAPQPPLIRRTAAKRYRFDLEPSATTIWTSAIAALLFAVWVYMTLAASVSIAVGVVMAAVVLGAFLLALWWMGWLDWFGTHTRISALRNLPPAPGLG
jgi:WXG100 protein secretion system (Wss), protein YukD